MPARFSLDELSHADPPIVTFVARFRFPVWLLLPITAAAAPVDFNRDIRPILFTKCIRCHGPDEHERKGGDHGLRLDLRAGALENLGGRTAITPGHPEQSELVTRITTDDEEDRMPPLKTGKALSAQEIDLLKRWIGEGATYAQHWSYEKPRRTAPPAVKDTVWPRGPIDRFILAKLEDANLRPQPEADRATLARRVALDLTGLPPTLEEADAFIRDRAADAYERFVDRQLAKPAYGEHWARLWLDLARYADSKGYADDQPRSIWRYRDTVIDAFNRNVPFDQFTVEQLAGDLLPNPTPEQIYATGFHRNTMNNTEGGTVDEEFRSVAVVDRVNTTMAVWMGTSMACAQCHTHKYDPLTQKEYFQLYAIFNQSEDADRNDEWPLAEFYTEAQQRERDAATREIAALVAKMRMAKGAHAAAAQTWAREFPTTLAWRVAQPASVKSTKGAEIAADADGRVHVTAAKELDTYFIELPSPAGETITALRIESLPLEPPEGVGAGAGAEGNFVVTRVRAAIRPAEAFRRARFVRVEFPGANRTIPLAELEVFSGGANVALHGKATQSSTAEGAVASRAIDGVTEGEVEKNSISLTESSDNPWWEVDLGATLPLDRIVMWGRTGLDPTPSGLKVVLLDEQHEPVWETLGRDAPKPSRTILPADPRDMKLARATADFAQADFDESLVIADQEPRIPNHHKPGAAKKGWGVAGATERGHALAIEPEKPFVLQPGESLVLTIDHRADLPKATLAHFRIGVTADARAHDLLRMPPLELAALAKAEATRDATEQEKLLDYYVREIAPEFRAEQKRAATLQQTLDDMVIQTTPIMRELPVTQQRTTHVQLRGSYLALGDEVSGGVPAVFPPLPAGAPVNRLTLARWLVSPENPLTARVQANRLWEAIFGIGIVRTTEEFGSQGEVPSHPELLDWLAGEMIDGGWNTKRFLKTLVTSAAYRQSSRVTAKALELDPENRLVSRGPRFRLGAEVVRDQALAVSGLLSAKMHGPSTRPYQPNSGLSAAFGSTLDWKTSAGEDRLRRALYTEWRRSSPYPSMVAFDAPNREVCTLRRNRSNTPLQALVTLNDPVYVEAAQALARLMVTEGETPADKVKAGFRHVLFRAPSAAEVSPLVALHDEALANFAAAPDKASALIANPENPPPSSVPAPELAAWTTVSNVLLNLDETLMKR